MALKRIGITVATLLVWCTAVYRASALNYGDMETLVTLGYRNSSAFTYIQENQNRPGIIITILSHAIVELDVTDPENLKPLAGIPNIVGFSDGFGANIRFHDPWDLVQLNQNSWIIADSGNNCLRNFNPRRNTLQQGSAINAWSFGCQWTNASSISSTVAQSYFNRPRGLVYEAMEDKIYVTYEQPFSLAEIHRSSERVVVLYASEAWQLRRIIPFPSEIIISTNPKYYAFSYRDSTLGAVVNDEWQSNVPSDQDYSQPYMSGLTSLPGDASFMQTISNENVLALVDQTRLVITKACTGERGHVDGKLNNCQLDNPGYITVINSTLYIGESGWSGGGIRTVPMFDVASPGGIEEEPSTKSPMTIGISVAVLVIVIVTIVGSVVLYRQKKRRNQIADNPPPVPAVRPSIQQRPQPAPRTYGVYNPTPMIANDQHPHAAETDHEYEYIISGSNSGYEYPQRQPGRGYTDLSISTEVCDQSPPGSKGSTMILPNGMVIYTGSPRTGTETLPYQGPDVPDQQQVLSQTGVSTISQSNFSHLTVDLPSAPDESDEEKLSNY